MPLIPLSLRNCGVECSVRWEVNRHTVCDALVPYPWSWSTGWCPTELDWRFGDRHRAELFGLRQPIGLGRCHIYLKDLNGDGKYTVAPKRIGAPVWGKAPEKQFFGRAPPLFFGSKSRPTINRFDERLRDGQCSLVSFLFAVFLLTQSHGDLSCPAIFKSGGTCPRALWRRLSKQYMFNDIRPRTSGYCAW